MIARRLSERALPDFSVLIDRESKFSLTPGDQQGRGREFVFQITGQSPRLYIGRFWLRTLAVAGHNGQLASFLREVSSRQSLAVSGEGGAPC